MKPNIRGPWPVATLEYVSVLLVEGEKRGEPKEDIEDAMRVAAVLNLTHRDRPPADFQVTSKVLEAADALDWSALVKAADAHRASITRLRVASPLDEWQPLVCPPIDLPAAMLEEPPSLRTTTGLLR